VGHTARMVSWKEFAAAEPDLAEKVQACFDAHTHKTLATLRRDGSPRISGIELHFTDGEVRFGTMSGSTKARDLLRDGRMAVHSASPDPETRSEVVEWAGDAKIAGRAVHFPDPATTEPSADAPPADATTFRIDVTEVVHNSLGGDPPDHMVIDYWTERTGRRRVERR
jgi:hypothetical protein